MNFITLNKKTKSKVLGLKIISIFFALTFFFVNTALAVTPTVSSISPDNGAAGGGTNVTITGTNFITPNAGGDGGWETVVGKTLPGNLYGAQKAVIGDNIYLFGGHNGSSYVNTIYTASVSDPTTWSIVAGKTLPESSYYAQLAVVGSNMYLFGGYNGSATTNAIYTASVSDPTTWSTVAGKTLPAVLGWSNLAIVGSNLYLFGGSNGASVLNVIYTATTADPTTWSVVGGKTLPGNLQSSQLAVIGNTLYLFGGHNGAATNIIYSASISDPTTWSTVADKTLPVNLFSSQLAVIGDSLYLFGGYNGSSYSNSIYTASVSDPTTWTTSASVLPATIGYSHSVTVDDYVYLFGGLNPAATNAIYRAPLTHNRPNVYNNSWLTNWTTGADQTNVTIGGTSATNVVVASATSITATTPAHAAGATDVVVTNYDGQAATLVDGYEYHNWITSGTYTSAVKSLSNTGFGNIAWVASTPTDTALTMRVKSCTTSDCSDKTSWAGCDLAEIDNGTDLSGKGCVIDGDDYAQYQAYLSTDSASAQPYLDSVTIATQTGYSTSLLNLISSPFDTGNPNNSVQKISWTAISDDSQIEGQVQMQVRTAPDDGGAPNFANSVWCGPTDCSATANSTSAFATSFYTDKTGATEINSVNNDLSDDQWIQYATFLKSFDGTITPTISNVTMQYSYNIPPAITEVGYTQNSNGSVSVPYTLSETYDDAGNIPHGISGSPIKSLLFYQPKNDVTLPAITNVQTGIVTLNNPSSVPIPAQGSMLVGDELIAFDSVGATGNQRNITARAAVFATSYLTSAVSHDADTPVFFQATRKTDGSALIHTIDTLVASGTPGAEASIENTFTWDPKNDSYLNLSGQRLTGMVLKVVANDADSTNLNNIGQSAATDAQVLDLENPKIKSITSTTDDGRYNAGKNVNVTINFADGAGNAKNVTATGSTTILLETGSNDYDCLISTISNASSASCTYQVQAEDESADLTAISVSGTIEDQFTNQLTDFAIPAGQNIADSKNIIIDTASPIITNIAPVADAFMNSTTIANGGSDISYEFVDILKTGSYIEFTSTAGGDLNTEYLCTLQGTALEVGTHSDFEIKQGANNCAEEQSALQSGSVYSMAIHAIDEADNVTDQTITSITFDTTGPTASITAPTDDAFFNNITDNSDVSYTVDESLQPGTYLRFTQTGGSADAQSPRTCNLTGTELTSGDHDNVDLNAACGGFSLVDGAIYDIDLHAVDLAGNESDATQKTNATFDATAPILTSFTSNKANNTAETGYGAGEEIDIRAVFNETLSTGSTITVRLDNSASPAVDVVLNQISDNVLSGTFVVDGPRRGYDTSDLTISQIVSQDVVDQAGNNGTGSTMPPGQNLGDNKDIVIDTGTPILVSFDARKMPSTTNGSFKEAEQLRITATYSKSIASGAITVHLNTENGVEKNTDIVLNTVSGITIYGTYTVADGDDADDLRVSSITAQSATDFKGNVLDRTGTMTDYDEYFTSLVGENISAVTNISNFQIDTTAPTLGVTPIAIANIDGKTSSTMPVITLDATDNFNLSDGSVYFSLNGGTDWCTPIDYSASITTFDITSSTCGGNTASGTKTISVKFQDAAGNYSTTASASVDFDNVKPQIQTFTTQTTDGIYGPGTDIEIIATYDESISSGTLVVNLNNGKQITLNTVENGNTLTETYTVGATASEEDTDRLRVASIVSQSVSDQTANVQDGTSIAGITENFDTEKTIVIDTTAPVASAPDGSVIADRADESDRIKIAIDPDDGGVAMDGMTAQIKLADTDGVCNFTGAATETFTSFPQTFTYDDLSGDFKKVCIKLVDQAGNISSEFSVFTPNTPENFVYTDLTSDTFTGAILKWDIPTQEGTGDFKQYNLLRCAGDGCTPVSNQTISTKSQNYHVFNDLNADTTYCYALSTQDGNDDISKITSPTICATPGEGPVASNTVTAFESDPFVANIGVSSANVVFKTIDSSGGDSPLATTAEVQVYSDENLATLVKTVADNDLAVTHSISLTGLESSTNYYLKISATDTSIESNPNRTEEVQFDETIPEKYAFETSGALSEITISNQPSIVTDTKAVVNFSTDQAARCFIDFKEDAITEYNEINSVLESEARKNHSITVSPLLAERKYDYKITCVDASDSSNVIYKGATEDDLLDSFTTLVAGVLSNEYDVTAPEISSVSLANVTGESATITWNTDEKANSLVTYETVDATFSMMAGDSTVSTDKDNFATSHSVTIAGLISATKYLFTVMSYDGSGNIGSSSQSTFTTKAPSSLSSIKVVSTALGQATVTWTTGAATTSTVNYGLTTSYGQSKQNSSSVKEHSITLTELTPGETYHFRVMGEDSQNNVFASSDITFQPKAPPKLSNFKIDAITEHGATITFTTNVPTDSLVTYTDTDNAENSGFQGKPEVATKHETVLKNIESGKTYAIKIKVRDEDGNETEESFQNFTTTKDEKPPVIDRVKTDTALTQNDKVQAIISWTTDEMATGKIIYKEGKAGQEKTFNVSDSPSFSHIGVITSFQPGIVYYFKVKSSDSVGNEGSSTDFAVLTPKKSQNIIQIIISNFTQIFGWAKL